jgi:hypothetical protein
MADQENRMDGNAADTTKELEAKDQQVLEKEQPEKLEPLFDEQEAEHFRTQWMNIQSQFVEDPKASVREADKLVADVLKSVSMGFHDRRTSLEKQWNNGNDEVSTEDLRQMVKRYRAFFNRLLTLKS